MSNENQKTSCCCCSPKQTSGEQSDVVLSKREIVPVDSLLAYKDYLGFVAMRLGFGRERYSVKPGLYSIGKPNAESPVLVTANYKMTFDVLRFHLSSLDAWILVLDTRGVNVWCAAGKGTFGTDELVRQVEKCSVASLVSHRELILPQLSGPGVAAHEVKRRTGFKVHYGPIRAKDMKSYWNAGRKVTPEMRRIEFPFCDRVVLSPLEVVCMFKWFCLLAVFVCLTSGWHGWSFSWERVVRVGVPAVGVLTTCWLAAAFLIPALFPWLPGRMLSTKGLCIGLLLGGMIRFLWSVFGMPFVNGVGMGGLALIVMALSGYFGLNLTGAMPYTSLSGVKKEIRRAVPMIAFLLITGMVLWMIGNFDRSFSC